MRTKLLLKKKKRSTKFQKWKQNHVKIPYYILFPSDLQTFLDQNLRAIDLAILAMINTSDGNGDCYMKDKVFAELLGKSESTIRNSLSRLRKAGLIHTEHYNGRRYLMATRFDPYRVNDITSKEEMQQKIDMADTAPTEEDLLDFETVMQDMVNDDMEEDIITQYLSEEE